MADFLWTTLPDGDLAFDPENDVLHIDNPNLSASEFVIGAKPAALELTHGGKTVALLINSRQGTTTNITFADGSMLILGDDTTGIANDGDANTLIGSAGGDHMIAYNGDDSLAGGGGRDLMRGNDGNDTFAGGGSADTMDGGTGDDTFLVQVSSDVVIERSGEGTDTVQSSATFTLPQHVENLVLKGAGAIGGTGNGAANSITGNGAANALSGGGGNDSVLGGGGDDALDGGAGNDTLGGGVGDDTMEGGTGNDSYIVQSVDDVVVELSGGGSDTVRSSVTYELSPHVEDLVLTGSGAIDGTGNNGANDITGNGSDNSLSGDNGNDSLVGGDGDDTLDGGEGDDTLDGGAGFDSLIGGKGDDLYICDGSEVMTEFADEGIDSMMMTEAISAPDNIENMTYIGTADDVGFGANELDNLITGNELSQTMSAGDGNDTISYAYETDAVAVDLEGSTATGGGGENDFIFDFENALGGAAGDTLLGNIEDNLLDGRGGDDTMEGGDGDDTYLVDDANDTVVETDNGPGALGGDPAAALDGFTDTVVAAITYSLEDSAFVENLTLEGAATEGTGNVLNNIITGNNRANTLNGLGGADTLDGGAGNDALNGGAGVDTVSYQSSTAAGVVVNLLRSGAQATGGSGADTLSSIERLTGSDFNDQLTGSNGANVLRGQGGGDTFNGRAGNDTFTGGAGADKFVFSTALNAATNVDDITDFTGVDLIRLDQSIFSAIATANAPLQAAAFTSGAGTTTASQANDRIIYDTSTGDLYYDADGSGAGATATHFATLTSQPAISAADFFIIP